MKKMLAFLLIITAILPIFTSCTQMADTSDDTEDTGYVEPDVTKVPNYIPDADFDPYHDEYGFVIFAPGDYLTDRKFDTDEYLPGYDANNAFIVPGNPSNGGICSNDDMIYYFCGVPADLINGKKAYTILMYRDKTTGESGPLCRKAECDHSDSSCDAYFTTSTSDLRGLFMYNGKIHWSTSTNVNRINPDSGEKEKVLTVPKGMFPEYNVNSVEAAVPHRGYIYYAGKSSTLSGGVYKYSLKISAEPIDGGDDGITILEREASSYTACNLRFVGNYVYIMISDYLLTGDAEVNSIELYRWDSKTRKAEMLYTFTDGWTDNGEDVWIDELGWFVIPGDGIYIVKGSYTHGEHYSLVKFRQGLCKYSFASRELEEVTWLKDNYSVMPFLSDDRVYASSSESIGMFDLNGNLVGEAADNVWWGGAFAGADSDFMYFASPSYGYITVPFDGGEILVLDEGE